MLLFINQSEIAIGMLFIVGATWPGKCIVGTTYAIEFFPKFMQNALILFILLSNTISIAVIPLTFEMK